MAPTRGKIRTKNRTNMRQISRAITFEPRRAVNLPVDPPPIRTSFHYNNVLEFTVRLVPDTSSIVPGFINIQYVSTTTTVLSWMNITVEDLYLAWRKFLQIEVDLSGLDTEITLHRVAYWGPSRSELTGLPIAVVVDVNAPASSISLRDVGTTNARAKVGVSIPQRIWYDVGTKKEPTKTVLARIVPDPDSTFVKAAAPLLKDHSDGFILGTVHMSMAVRRSRLF